MFDWPAWLNFIVLILLLGLGGLLWHQQWRLGQQFAGLKAAQASAQQQLWNQIEAWGWLRDRLGLRQGLYLDPIWSASPDFLKLIAQQCLERRPGLIVECSSGASTLVLAAACRINGRGRVLSLENGAEHAARTRAELERHGLDAFAEVRHAPLEPLELENGRWLWYRSAALPEFLPVPSEGSIDLLVIDGPPGRLQPLSRYPALPLLWPGLAADALIMLDDAARPDEQEMLRLWQAGFPELKSEYLETARGCSILRRQPPALDNSAQVYAKVIG